MSGLPATDAPRARSSKWRYVRREGYTLRWDRDEKHDIREAVRHRWEAIKDGRRLSEIPGFPESVRRLYRQGYGQTDISVMFGVTRECARLWIREFVPEYEPTPGAATDSRYRVWDPVACEFVAVELDEFMAVIAWSAHARERERARREIAERRRRERARHVAAIRRFVALNGRTPLQTEISEAVGIESWSGVLHYWRGKSRSNRDISYKVAYRRLMRASGCEANSPGGGPR